MFASDFETNTNVTTNRYDEKDSLKYSVDVRYFGLFIALQLFIQKTIEINQMRLKGKNILRVE